MSDQWEILQARKATKLLKDVREDAFSVLFEPALCEFFIHPLDFFNGFDLIRISNHYSPPFMNFDYVSNGEQHYYLDGTDHAFQTLVRQGSVHITEDNVLAYIDMYFTYVYERGNSIVFIRDPQDTNFKGSDGMGVHFKALQKHQNLDVSWNEKRQIFVIKTPLLYQNKTHQGVVNVHQDGCIEVVKPLRVSFLDTPDIFEDIEYVHPKEDAILEQAYGLIEKTKTGKRLLDLMREKEIPVRVLGSCNYQAVATNLPMIYLFMPSAQYTADYHQALQLVGAMRDVEQILNAYPRPSHEEPEEVFYAVSHDKNLNLLLEICKMVEELDEQGIEDGVSAMRRIGIEDVYTGFKNNLSPEALLRVYETMMMKQGFLVKE